jgi:hypothetical protein
VRSAAVAQQQAHLHNKSVQEHTACVAAHLDYPIKTWHLHKITPKVFLFPPAFNQANMVMTMRVAYREVTVALVLACNTAFHARYLLCSRHQYASTCSYSKTHRLENEVNASHSIAHQSSRYVLAMMKSAVFMLIRSAVNCALKW